MKHDDAEDIKCELRHDPGRGGATRIGSNIIFPEIYLFMFEPFGFGNGVQLSVYSYLNPSGSGMVSNCPSIHI